MLGNCMIEDKKSSLLDPMLRFSAGNSGHDTLEDIWLMKYSRFPILSF